MTLSALLTSLALAASAPGGPLSVGLVPALGPKVAQADAKQIAGYLQKQLNRPVNSVVFKSYEDLAMALVDEKVDFAWMPPLQGFNAKLGGATLVSKLIRNGSPHYRAVLFTRADQKYTDLASLQGTKVAWVERSSSTGYLYPLAVLAKAGLPPAKLFTEQKFLGSHEAVCKAVESKQVEVGATFADEPASGKDLATIVVNGCMGGGNKGPAKFKVVAVSDPVPNDVLVLRKDLDAASATALTQAVLAMPKDKEGKAVLKHAFNAEGIAPVQENDFDSLQRALEASSDYAAGK